MRVLITGGAGFIGTRLTLELNFRGHEITIIDNLNPQVHGEIRDFPAALTRSAQCIKADVRDKPLMLDHIQQSDAVIHLAAETGTGQSMYQIRHYTDVNIGGVAVLTDILANHTHRIRKVIVASSRAVYGEGKYACKQCGVVYPKSRDERQLMAKDWDLKCTSCRGNLSPVPVDEESPLQSQSIYALTKEMQEKMILMMGRALKISTVALRYQNVYGCGQSLKNPYTGIISIFSNQIRKGAAILLYEDGLESRDFVYVDDVVRGTILSLENTDIRCGAYNLGTGRLTTVKQVALTLMEAFDLQVPTVVTGRYRVGDIRHCCADLASIRKVLGYEPTVSFAEGIRRYVMWFSEQEKEEDLQEKATDELLERGLMR